MNSFNLVNLVLHIMFGLLGVAASYGYLTNLTRLKLRLDFLKSMSAGAAVFYILSWLSGGWYYLYQYGPAVRAGIKAGRYAWAHAIFMESKEHVFLFLPILAVVLAVLTVVVGEQLEQHERLRRSLTWLAGVTVAIGLLVTVSGVAISGAVR